jgi:hypothetical protein
MDLTEQELLDLTDEQRRRYVEIADSYDLAAGEVANA